MEKLISLKVSCPVCNKSLMDQEVLLDHKPSIKLNCNTTSQRGTLRLSSVYGSYIYRTDFQVEEGEEVEFYCPHCNKVLTSSSSCQRCNSPMVSFLMDMGGRVNICSRKGCENHFIAFEDVDEALRRFFQELQGL